MGKLEIKECSHKLGMNYFHLSQVLIRFEKEGIINRKRKEDQKRGEHPFEISLTEKGREMTRVLSELKHIIEHYDEEHSKDLEIIKRQREEIKEEEEIEKCKTTNY